MKNFINKYKYQFLLFFIILVFFLVNYKPETYLSGWDNLQTELYPWLAVKRAFWAVWQEYQSFGLVSGMTHASDLFRALFVWVISFVIPQNLIRYFYHFLMLLLGGLGMMRLLRGVYPASGGARNNNNETISSLGALFYMLNFGTVQIFYMPYEPFSTFFVFLPWAVWSFLRITSSVKHQTYKKELLLFFFINFLGTPSFYIQTLFVVYILILLCLLIGSRVDLKRGFLMIFLIFIVNSFWILPQIYFLKTNGWVVNEAKINQLATENVLYQNQEKGSMANFLRFEGFYTDLVDINNQSLFQPWKTHFENTLFRLLPYLFYLIIILGIIKPSKHRVSFLLGYLLVLIAFLSSTPPFSLLNNLLRQNQLINQIFRSPFTKFIIPYSLIAGYFFTQGLFFIKSNFIKVKSIRFMFYILCFVLIIIYSLPSFQGYFFSPAMKIKIPNDYFELIKYFKKEVKNKRIALLPEYTFWGWFKHRWGYDGSGFLWYGVEQPIISRTFDVWSNKSEGYFWEMKRAIDSENPDLFDKVIEKYDIDYLIVDYSLIPVSGSIKALQYDTIDSLISQNKTIELVNKWPNIGLFKINHRYQDKNFITLSNELPNIGPAVKITDEDWAYFENGVYQTDSEKAFDKYYPFLDAASKWGIKEEDDKFIITTSINNRINLIDYSMKLSSSTAEAVLYQNNELKKYTVGIEPEIRRNSLTVSFPKILIKQFKPVETSVNHCDRQIGQIKQNANGSYQTVESLKGATACFGYYSQELENRYGYLVKIENKNIAGRRLFFFIQDNTKKQTQLEDRLKNDIEYFFLSPGYKYGVGYSFSFQNNSYQNLLSANQLENLEVYLLPIDLLKNIVLVNKNHNTKKVEFNNQFSVNKKNYYFYEIDLPNNKTSNFITLYQAYDSGWKAYTVQSSTSNVKRFLTNIFPFFFGQELKNHVLVNNWANGFLVENSQSWSKLVETGQAKIVFIFWPQYLEYLGFGLLILAFLTIFLYNKKYG